MDSFYPWKLIKNCLVCIRKSDLAANWLSLHRCGIRLVYVCWRRGIALQDDRFSSGHRGRDQTYSLVRNYRYYGGISRSQYSHLLEEEPGESNYLLWAGSLSCNFINQFESFQSWIEWPDIPAHQFHDILRLLLWQRCAHNRSNDKLVHYFLHGLHNHL